MLQQPRIVDRRNIAVAAFAAVVLLAVTSVGRAQSGPAPGASAVDQYAEAVPTSRGPSVPGVTKETRTSLPPDTKRALKKAPASQASALERIATSSVYGAPKTVPTTHPTPGDTDMSSSTSASAVLASTVAVAAATDDARLLGLLAILLVTTVAAIVLAIRRAGV